MKKRRRAAVLILTVAFLLVAVPLFAQEVGKETEYGTFFGLDSRLVIWIIAELHLMYGAFVLGVPIFAVLVE